MAASDFFAYQNPSKNSTGYRYATGMDAWRQRNTGVYNPLRPQRGLPGDKVRNQFYEQNYLKDPPNKLMSGLGKGAIGAFSIYAANKAYGEEYGAGAATVYGLATMNPVLGTAALIGEVGVAALSYGHQQYHERRRMNFGAPVQDQFGTLATMRQRSLENLSRGRAALGNEARLHHF
jgi:hypothetical protein